MWKENLFQNLLVVIILLSLAIIIYCRVTGKSLIDVIKEIREGFSSPIE